MEHEGARRSGDRPNARRDQPLFASDRQFVLVSDRTVGTPPTPDAGSSGSRRAHADQSRPLTSLDAASDVCVTPVGGERRPVAGETLPSSGRSAGDGAGCATEPVVVPDAMVRGYRGFAADVLRPLAHSASDRVASPAGRWESYRDVNDRVAATVSDLVSDEAIVWIADHHFASLARRLRPSLPDEAFLFQHWPIPWPPWETLRDSPHAEAIVRSLLDTDLVGFAVARDCDAFLHTADELVPGTSVDRDSSRIEYDGSPTAVRSIPEGVPVGRVDDLAVSRTVDGVVTRFRDAHGISADRPLVLLLDGPESETGLTRCLRTLERAWSNAGLGRGAFTLVSLDERWGSASSRRSDAGGVSRAVERLNERFGTDDWQPVVTHAERLAAGERYALYRDAAVGVATSVRGSGIPETQEFVAAQSADPGVLLVSSETETSNRLERDTLTFSPFEASSFVHRLDEGLHLGPQPRDEMMTDLARRVRAYDDETWLQCVTGVVRGLERRRAGEGPS
jgi:trehalose 6-phosphate synthase